MITPLANLLFAPENWLVIGLVALLLFGKRLPEVGRSLGKGIIEFKKGLAGIEEDVTQAGQQPSQPQQPSIARTDRAALPPAEGFKFDPYTGKPIAQEPAVQPMRFDPYTGKAITEQSTTSSTT